MTPTETCPTTVMRERCATCAFRPGTEAAESEWTQTLLKLCIYAGVPFECHGELGAGHLCNGFVDAFVAKLAVGDYERLPEWKRELALKLMDALEDFRVAANRGDKFDVDGAIRAAVDAAIGGAHA